MAQPLTLAVDDEALRISYRLGDPHTLVVAFTGIGHALGGIQTEEFGKSLEYGAPSVIFVIDKNRRWYNHGLRGRIVPALNGLISQLGGFRRVVTLGNSMGGFGAIIFAKNISGCTAAIAFCPQSSVHPEIARFDKRWPNWRADIREWDVPDGLTELDSRIRYHLFFGTDDTTDLQHARRFAGLPNVSVNLVAGCGHEIAAGLKRQGKLAETIGEIVWSDAGM